MTAQPTLTTARLKLRPYTPADAGDITRLANDAEVTRYMPNLPYPYAREDAVQWLAALPERFARQELVVFAITLKEGGTYLGSVGLTLALPHDRAELGYWLGRAYWGRGYALEAARAVLDYAFEGLKLHSVHAYHFRPNQASGHVLERLGMHRDGVSPECFKFRGAYMDDVLYSILQSEWAAKKAAGRR